MHTLCCFRAGTLAVQDDCTSEQLNQNTAHIPDSNSTDERCHLSSVVCQSQPASKAGESSTGARKSGGRTQQWRLFDARRKNTPCARHQGPASPDASSAACKSSSKGEKIGSSMQGSSSKSRASTSASCMSGCLSRRSRGRTPKAAGCEGTSSAASKGTTSLRNRLLSLQSSGSLIPAGFLQPPPASTIGDDCSSGSRTAAALSLSAPLSSGRSDSTNFASDAAVKAPCAEAGQKQAQHSSSNTSTALQSHNDGEAGVLVAPGLTLVVSSHSSSSHQGSPMVEQGDRSPSRGGSSSSRASSDSGHTAFASIPSIIHSSASPDSMLSAFSTTSSCVSSNCGGSCCAISKQAEIAAAPAALQALPAAASLAADDSEPQQQQQWLSLQGASSVQQLHLDVDTEAHMPTAPQQQQQEQQAVSNQQQQEPAGTVGVVVTGSSPAVQQQQQQQEPMLDSTYASVGDLIQAANKPEQPEQQQRQPEFWRASGWSFSAQSEQNLRSYQEDRTVAIDLTGHAAFPPSERAGLFSVYDGHGGHQVAEFLAEHVKGALLAAGPDAITDSPLSVLGQAVEDAERQLLASYTDGTSTAAAGSTLCAVLMIDDKLHVAHVGDSRAVLARGSAAKQLTRDHKPACAIEAKRIMSDDPDAEITPDGYLYSELAVARAIGSAHLKRDPSKRALIATAETVTVQLQRQDDFVIVATDGLWDTVSSSEAVTVARRVLVDTKDAAAASRALVERAQKCGSSDNISVVTLLLHSRGIAVPRSNSRLFKRTPSQQQSFAGASSSADGGSSVPTQQPSAAAGSGMDSTSSNAMPV